MVKFIDLVKEMLEKNASDLHVSAGSKPRLRVHGVLAETSHPEMSAQDVQELMFSMLTDEQKQRLQEDLELDLSLKFEGMCRLRANLCLERGSVRGTMRMIPEVVQTFEDLGLPRTLCEEVCHKPKGLVLVTGATGSGKSTTLAAMVDYLNQTRQGHILTIEDPIEFLHTNKKCLVTQRELGGDTRSFMNALRGSLRQDPDIVLIGEMRDKETMEAAMVIAETGHLTFGTLHTNDAPQTISRIVDTFPAHQQQQCRVQLSMILEGVFCQQLLPHASGHGRTMVAEIMLPNNAIRALIREDKIHQIPGVIQTQASKGMKTMNQALRDALKAELITKDIAMLHSTDPDELRGYLGLEGVTAPAHHDGAHPDVHAPAAAHAAPAHPEKEHHGLFGMKK